MQKTLLKLLVLVFSLVATGQPSEKNKAPDLLQIDHRSSPRPDRIILTWEDNTTNSQTVTWRTDPSVDMGRAQIAKVSKDVNFYKDHTAYTAITQKVNTVDEEVNYHKTTFKNLEPNTLYAYRVGSDDYWSEWIQFRTPEARFEKPFEFVYFGDAQNDIFPLWSRVVREAYKKSPNARFMLHAGDLINHSQNNYQWGEWFEAGSFIFKKVPQIAVVGNHEYIKNEEGKKVEVSPLWDPQFNFPKNGPEGFEDRTYYIDYLNCKIIGLDSNKGIETQALWLENVLKENTKEWVIITFHHPVISGAEGRVNKGIMQNWKPILDKCKVDLVLQGHDHVYGRGNNVNSGLNKWDENSGTVYVVSVSGRKMYDLSNHPWMQKKRRKYAALSNYHY